MNSSNSSPTNSDCMTQTQPEITKMKLFQTPRKYFSNLGIDPTLVDQTYPINRQVAAGFVMNISALLSFAIFMTYEAKTFLEFSQSIYFCSVILLILFVLAMLAIRVELLFKFIDNFENAIYTSKLATGQLISNEEFKTFTKYRNYSKSIPKC